MLKHGHLYPANQASIQIVFGPLLQTKLVALQVLHHNPVLSVLFVGTELRSAKAADSLHSRIDTGAALVGWRSMTSADIHIRVDTILDHLGFWHPLEVDAWPTPFRIDNRACPVPLRLRNTNCRQEIRPACIALWWVLQLVPQCLSLERRHARRVGTIKRDLKLRKQVGEVFIREQYPS
jgi:hypothetical protein